MAPLLSFFSSLPPVLSLSGERNNEMGDEKGKREEVSDKRPTGVWNPFLGEQVRSEMIRRVWPLAAAVRCCCRRQRVPCLQINNGKGEQRKKNERRGKGDHKLMIWQMFVWTAIPSFPCFTHRHLTERKSDQRSESELLFEYS
jgi:hypothetical protein